MPGKAPGVLLAMSGGVDSAVCVPLLRRQGFDVQGLVLRFSAAHDAAVNAAKRAADELDVPLMVGRCETDFEKHVVGPFCAAYAAGRTPNPCVVCNPLVKFRHLAAHARRLGAEYIATGHYAQVVRQDGLYYVAEAASRARDQSYMLYRLPQDILCRLLLPAGPMEKADVRLLAAGKNLSSAGAPDSQEICFVPDGDYAAFIAGRGTPGKQGRFIGPSGEDLGPHRGVVHYTVGQRRGLGVALGQPVFVHGILPDGNVRLALEANTYASAVQISDCVFTGGQAPDDAPYLVKIRSVAKPVPCRVQPLAPDRYKIIFQTPRRSPAPGQHAVLYRGGLVMGGGVMENPEY